MSDGWSYSNEMYVDGKNMSVLDCKTPEQVEKCKAHCMTQGYFAFTTWRGKAFFRDLGRGEIAKEKKKMLGSELYIAPAETAQKAKTKPKPKTKAKKTEVSPPSPPKTPTKAAKQSPTPTQTQLTEVYQGFNQFSVEQPISTFCFHCKKSIDGEHLLVEMPGQGELPVHAECYEECIPTCAWCRVELTDSYVLYKGQKYGIVTLHEGCKDAFVAGNVGTKSDQDIKSLSLPSAARNAGKNTDRLFIDGLSMQELQHELARRGLGVLACGSRAELIQSLREHWEDQLVA